MALSHILGYPRIGPNRETKKAVEAYWRNDISQAQLLETGYKIRKEIWQTQANAGLDVVTVGDFSFYDHVLDTTLMFGVVPERFGEIKGDAHLDLFFRMARGAAPSGEKTNACEMTKWFDTNYHYIVPEFSSDQEFKLSTSKLFDEIREAQALGYKVKPVLLGPLSLLWLGKSKGEEFDKLELLPALLQAYMEVLAQIKSQDVEWIQIDEPILALDLPDPWLRRYEWCYQQLAHAKLNILLATYFGPITHNISSIANLPFAGLHIDLVRGPEQITSIIDRLSSYQILSVGIVNGRNIWANDLQASLKTLEEVKTRIGSDRLWVSSSCSLLHSPVDLDLEEKLDPEIKQWLAFAKQKISEIVTLTQGMNSGAESIKSELDTASNIVQSRQNSSKIHKPDVLQRVKNITPDDAKRNSEFPERCKLQHQELKLPLMPTTTIGSFPQTNEIRASRKKFKSQEISAAEYQQAMEKEIQHVIAEQEYLQLDVLVHGEPERNDMVEYFGELLEGFVFTQYGWVQSYGSRCVKPPIIYGDIRRTTDMTVAWSTFAQQQTKLPMKGMLTGPVTILAWSFARDDQPESSTAMQIALAIRDEVVALEEAGIKVIQIDEPAFRETLPLLQADQKEYLDWATTAFRIATSGVKDSTQIHTHMCYSEFNELIAYIAAMDADVISIEASRSQMELLTAFEDFSYPNEIGPGIYDIHSPNIPSTEQIVTLLEKAATKIPVERLWVNPDCGLKTRNWPEVKEALQNMVAAAKILREKKKSAVA